jgi:hypothetical protein
LCFFWLFRFLSGIDRRYGGSDGTCNQTRRVNDEVGLQPFIDDFYADPREPDNDDAWPKIHIDAIGKNRQPLVLCKIGVEGNDKCQNEGVEVVWWLYRAKKGQM